MGHPRGQIIYPIFSSTVILERRSSVRRVEDFEGSLYSGSPFPHEYSTAMNIAIEKNEDERIGFIEKLDWHICHKP
jgi:hypothetical protein